MALAYAAIAFDHVASSLDLPAPHKSSELLALDYPLSRIDAVIHPGGNKTVFVHGYALIIGVGETLDARLSLPVTQVDAETVAKLFQERAGYRSMNCRILTAENATTDGIRSGFLWLADQIDADSDAMIVVYYSGHGFELGNSSYYLIPHESRQSDIPGTAIPIQMFNAWLANLRAKQLVAFMDCCHAGGAALSKDIQGFVPKAVPIDLMTKGAGRALIASSKDRQPSYVLKGHANSLFTEVLLESLSRPGEVEILDVFKLVRKGVKERALSANVEQTPVFNAVDLERIVIAC